MKFYFFITFLTLLQMNLCPLSIGSEIAVSRNISNPVFPQADTDNQMIGFISIENGFNLETSQTTCTFDASFPVSGQISLNHGTLYLTEDLIISNSSSFVSGGTIIGNGCTFRLPTGLNSFNFPLNTIETFSLVDRFAGPDVLNAVDWSFDNDYLAAGFDYSNTSSNLQLYYFDGNTLTFTNGDASTAGTDVLSVRWDPTDSFLFVTRSAGTDLEIEVYSFDAALGALTSLDTINNANTFAVSAWHPAGTSIAIGTTILTIELALLSFNGSTLAVADTIDIVPNRIIGAKALSWDSAGNYLAAGVNDDGGTEPELLLYSLSGATLTLTVSAEVGPDVNAVDFSPTGSFIAVGTVADTETLKVFEHRFQDGTLYEVQSARIGETVAVNSLHWSSDGNTLLVGLGTGSGTEVRTYAFDKTARTLTLNRSFNSTGNINDIRWSPNNNYIVTGDDVFDVSVYDLSDNNYTLSDVDMSLQSNVTLNAPLKFRGLSKILGNGNTLSLSFTTSIVVESGGILKISNARIIGLNSTNFGCDSNDASMMLENCTIVLSNNAEFQNGSILFQGNTKITGTNKFIYTSAMSSTIDSSSTLLIDSRVTLSIDPSSDNRFNIVMESDAATLHLNSCTFHTSSTGATLANGRLLISGKTIFSNDGSSEPEGIQFGDGTLDGDLTIEFMPGANIEHTNGYLISKDFS